MSSVKKEMAGKFLDIADRLKRLSGGLIGYLDKITQDYHDDKYTDEQYRGLWKGMKEKYVPASGELILELVKLGDQIVESNINKKYQLQKVQK
jgi:hypothetical protein